MVFGLFKKNKDTPSKYHQWVVKDIVWETNDAVSIVFDITAKTTAYQSGHFITLIVSIDGKEVRRSYSLCSSPFVERDLAITVKRVQGGACSNHLLDTLKPGDTLKVIRPAGKFVVDYHQHSQRHFVLFAGGVGITPLISILKSVLHQEPNSIVSLMYCNRDVESIIFKKELDQLEEAYRDRLRVAYALDEAPEGWRGYTGALDEAIFSAFMDTLPTWSKEDMMYMMCGPEGMMSVLESFLSDRGVPAGQIRKELFKPSVVAKAAKPVSKPPCIVKVICDGEEYQLTVKPGNTILDTALDQGIDLPFSCQSGVCTACRGKVLSGRVDITDAEGLSDTEREEGYVLTCVGHPLTDDVVIEIG